MLSPKFTRLHMREMTKNTVKRALPIVGVEPTTFALLAQRSNRLSHTATKC